LQALGAFGTATLHAAAAHQHRDAPLNAGTETLAPLERHRPKTSELNRTKFSLKSIMYD
jgi:hypothetical protein